jgi:deoxycytidylate deaminase
MLTQQELHPHKIQEEPDTGLHQISCTAGAFNKDKRQLTAAVLRARKLLGIEYAQVQKQMLHCPMHNAHAAAAQWLPLRDI